MKAGDSREGSLKLLAKSPKTAFVFPEPHDEGISVIQRLCRMEPPAPQGIPGAKPLYWRLFRPAGPADEREHVLLCHTAQCLERGTHLLL